jgi:hypothetical protein
MTFLQIIRHVRGPFRNGPNWFERGLLILAVLTGVGAVVSVVVQR